MSIRLYIELGAALILAAAFAPYTAHERRVGEATVHAADAKAEKAERAKADAETLLNNERNTKAEENAAYVQQALDDYRAAHPLEPIRVCHDAGTGGHLPEARATSGGSHSAGAGPEALPEVPRGDPGPDIGPRLDAIMRVSERMAVLYGQYQQREGVKP